ncbi:MAG: ketohydroxyglutarate aldolase [Nostocaceae cyanobacterium]|nr:ketohydroxyglutarate aldolase [Nostocaceae cyanobacterium]
MSQVNLTVAVKDSHLDRMPEVIQKLQSVGMKVEESLSPMGIVIGSCSQAQVEVLRHVEGVAGVEPQGQYQLAPPNADIQ